MPRVKIDYIVSFSSEDPEHPANNLLNKEVSKKKWLCMKGEMSCSVVLQLAKAVKISGVHIGAYHAALVEVLVARSETSSDQYQVLVPSSVLVSREESRRGEAVSRVRSFAAEQLSEPARDQRWDRVRIVCSQPYNKHCKYGLSFVHIDEAESAGAGSAVPPRLLAFDTFSSDEDEFKPGELFAQHLQKNSAETTATTTLNTGAQIRQATSQALKNISESSTKLTKATISKRDSTAAERFQDNDRSVVVSRRDKTSASRDQPSTSRDQTSASRDQTSASRDQTSASRDQTSASRDYVHSSRDRSRASTDALQRRSHTHQNNQSSSTQKTDDQMRKRRRSNSEEDCPVARSRARRSCARCGRARRAGGRGPPPRRAGSGWSSAPRAAAACRGAGSPPSPRTRAPSPAPSPATPTQKGTQTRRSKKSSENRRNVGCQMKRAQMRATKLVRRNLRLKVWKRAILRTRRRRRRRRPSRYARASLATCAPTPDWCSIWSMVCRKRHWTRIAWWTTWCAARAARAAARGWRARCARACRRRGWRARCGRTTPSGPDHTEQGNFR